MNNNHIISDNIFNFLLDTLPSPKQKNRGRKRIKKEALLKGILQVLKLGIPWKHIDNTGCSWAPCYRYFKELQRRGVFKQKFYDFSNINLDKSVCSSDTSNVVSFRFNNLVSYDGKHKDYSTKLSLIIDKNGRPFDIKFDKGSKHDLAMLIKHLENTTLERDTELNLDKGYTKLDLRRSLRKSRIRVNMEYKEGDYKHKRGPKHKFKPDIYEGRFMIERLFAWIKAFKRLRLRVDRNVSMFKAFIYLTLLIILFRLGI